MKIIARLLFIPIAAAVIVFAVSNRDPIAVDLWPLPFEAALPLYAVVLGTLAIGIVLGASISWISGGKWRRRARSSARKTVSLERQLSTTSRPAMRPALADRTPSRRVRAALDDG